MSSVNAGVGIGPVGAKASVAAPAWVWVAIAAAAVGAVWVYCRSVDEDVPDWRDPNQPPINAMPDYSTTLLGTFATAPGQDLGGNKPPTRYLWNSLMESPCCWVGDC